MNILEISGRLRRRDLSPVELTRECLRRIETVNPVLNAFITVTAESALAQAHAAEQEIARGEWRGPLHGIPIGLKDLIDTADVLTTAGSALFKDRIPHADAEVVRQLQKAGAIFLGKQNLHEFAYGGSSMVSAYGPVRNPWNPERIAGGSSGGSAASVGAGLCYAAVGTDTAGSIREPASLCGVVGFKPSFGMVGTHGIFPLSASYDHAGPIARTVSDAALMLQALLGQDGRADDFISELQTPPPAPLRFGISRSFFYEDIDPEVASAVEEALGVLRSFGEVREIVMGEVPVDRTLQAAESYEVHADFVSRNPELYQPETLRRILNGANADQEEVARHREGLQQQRRDIAALFNRVDFLMSPTVPIPAPSISTLQQQPEQLRPTELILLRNTRPFNVWGLPAISVPCGFTRTGLPIGLQIAGPHGGDARVLRLAHAYEQATGWHETRPAGLESL
jgi:aspartyl-tRNA(Asn)/glutamyl-tRNA(Gln) amidotransferase subunit A